MFARICSERRKGVLLIRGLSSKSGFHGFRGFRGFLKILEFLLFDKGLFSKFHLVVLVFSVVLVVCSMKKNEPPPSLTTPFQHSDLLTPRFVAPLCVLLIKKEKSAQRGSFWNGYPANIQGPFARISRPKTSVRALKILEKTSIWARTSMTRRRGRPRP